MRLQAKSEDVGKQESMLSHNSAFPEGMKIWYDPPPANHMVDIVFVHGLTGDRDHTWTHHQAKEPWPKTILPLRYGEARILTYGYDAYVVRKSGPVTKQTFSQHSRTFLNCLLAQRPRNDRFSHEKSLILVAHSLGGLLCKDALLLSHHSSDPFERSPFEALIGIAFIGTPHTGSRLAKWGDIAANIAKLVLKTNRRLLDVLKIDSEVSSRVHAAFMEMMANTKKNVRIACFYELLPMGSRFGPIIVPYESAVIRLRSSVEIAIRADHRDMARFRDFGIEDLGRDQFLNFMNDCLISCGDRDDSADLSDDEREKLKVRCLASLEFPKMTKRKGNIRMPLDGTCEWIFEHESYKRWVELRKPEADTKSPVNNQHEGGGAPRSNLLWIKGKPGSGKSTMMKRLYSRLHQRSLAFEWCCLGFFFSAQGTPLEKTPGGLYRTLLHQLLSRSPAAFRRLIPTLKEKPGYVSLQPFSWEDSELEDVFHMLISEEDKTPCYILIDALDECDDVTVRDVVRAFEATAAKAKSNGTKLRVCLSSRHYPDIFMKDAVEVCYEKHNTPDILLYIKNQPILNDLAISAEIEKSLADRADGMFMWVKLVCIRLCRAKEDHYTRQEQLALLHESPAEIEAMFGKITEMMDAAKLRESLKIVQLVNGARRPLSWQELYLALKFCDDLPPTTFSQLATLSVHEGRDLESFRGFLLANTSGLLELQGSSDQWTVQFIHETVRDFLKSSTALRLYGFVSLDEFTASTKALMERCFANYIKVNEIKSAFVERRTQQIISAKELVEYCYGNRSALVNLPLHAQNHVPFHSLSEYFVVYGLGHLEETPEFVALLERGFELDKSATAALRSMIVAWVFTYCLITELLEDRPNRAQQIIRTEGFLPFLERHAGYLRLSSKELARIVACVNNRNVFTRDLGLISENSKALELIRSGEYWHLFLIPRDERFSMVSEISDGFQMVNSKVSSQEYQQLDLRKAVSMIPHRKCGVAFFAHFRVEHPQKILLSHLREWTIAEDLLDACDLPRSANLPVRTVPFHAAFDHGYISVLLRKTESAGSIYSPSRPVEILRIFEVPEHGEWRSEQLPRLSNFLPEHEKPSDGLNTQSSGGNGKMQIWLASSRIAEAFKPEEGIASTRFDNLNYQVPSMADGDVEPGMIKTQRIYEDETSEIRHQADQQLLTTTFRWWDGSINYPDWEDMISDIGPLGVSPELSSTESPVPSGRVVEKMEAVDLLSAVLQGSSWAYSGGDTMHCTSEALQTSRCL